MEYKFIDGVYYQPIDTTEITAKIERLNATIKPCQDGIETCKTQIQAYEAQIANYKNQIEATVRDSGIDLDFAKAVIPEKCSFLG